MTEESHLVAKFKAKFGVSNRVMANLLAIKARIE